MTVSRAASGAAASAATGAAFGIATGSRIGLPVSSGAGLSSTSSRPRLVRRIDPEADVLPAPRDVVELMGTLTARDVGILMALRQYRYLDLEQIRRLFFRSHRRAQARTQWLTEHHLVVRWAASDISTLHRRPSVFCVSVRGAGVLAACLEQPRRMHIDHARHARDHCFHVTHDLEANGFFVELAAATAPLQEVGLYHWVGDEDCRRLYRIRGSELAPDGWGRLLTPAGDALFFLEWDRGTESPARIAAKVSGYLTYFADKAAADLNHVLFVAPGPAREESIRSTVDRLLPSSSCSFWSTNTDLLSAHGSLGGIWSRAEGDSPARISIVSLPAHSRSPRSLTQCIGKPAWWEYRHGGGAGA